jgi:hydrogenase nickel incorporation protein HypA/HybF
MHELSLAFEIVNLVETEARNHGAEKVFGVTLQIGTLSGVDAEAVMYALEFTVPGTMLEKSKFFLHTEKGMGRCFNCDITFEMDSRTQGCPRCGMVPVQVTGGNSFSVLSIEAE